MINNKIQLFLGIVSAPMLVLFALPLFNCIYPIFKRNLSCMQGVASFAFYGIPVVIISIIISLPFVYFFIKKRWVGIVHFGIGGILVSLIISVLMIFFGEGTNVAGVFIAMISMGVSASLLFWFIAIRNNLKYKE